MCIVRSNLLDIAVFACPGAFHVHLLAPFAHCGVLLSINQKGRLQESGVSSARPLFSDKSPSALSRYGAGPGSPISDSSPLAAGSDSLTGPASPVVDDAGPICAADVHTPPALHASVDCVESMSLRASAQRQQMQADTVDAADTTARGRPPVLTIDDNCDDAAPHDGQLSTKSLAAQTNWLLRSSPGRRCDFHISVSVFSSSMSVSSLKIFVMR
jgi:hypothetical protein